MKKTVVFLFVLILVLAMTALPAFASAAEDNAPAETAEVGEETQADDSKSAKAIAAAIVVGIAAAAGAIAMGQAISKSVDGIARQPEAEGKIRTTLMLGLVFVETAIIYALVIAILIIFVL